MQGIVSAPITASIAGVDGLTNTVHKAATTALTRITNGAASVVLGSGTIVPGY
ncbi:hypothetical protein [Mycobacterium sp.]|uniref:hypothetical protein n=1 Tax=Mycobacterium sp. TaxID=1785 RepID=UPI00333EFF63